MFNEFDLMVFDVCKKVFYALPGAPIYGYPVGQLVSLTVLLYAIGEAVLYLVLNKAVKQKKVNKK